jgi:hypothetical protein
MQAHGFNPRAYEVMKSWFLTVLLFSNGSTCVPLRREEADSGALPTSVNVLLHFAFSRQGLVVGMYALHSVAPIYSLKRPVSTLEPNILVISWFQSLLSYSTRTATWWFWRRLWCLQPIKTKPRRKNWRWQTSPPLPRRPRRRTALTRTVGFALLT